MTSRADALLSGPRGRRLCLGLVLDPEVPGWPKLTWTDGPAGHPVGRVDPTEARQALAAAVAALDVVSIARTTDPLAFLPALLAAVDSARYWQEPFDTDALLDDPAVAAELRPVAEAVAVAPAAAWWSGPLDPGAQHSVRWEPADTTPRTTGSRPALDAWRVHTAADERRAAHERPADPRAPWSGEWWSTPVTADLVVTTRSLPGAHPVQLLLVEDELGWRTAATWPVPVPGWARVREVGSAEDWVALVARHPLAVTASRRHDWWRATGQEGPWLLPDWSALAQQHDAVHLTVDGYLSAAGRRCRCRGPGRPPCSPAGTPTPPGGSPTWSSWASRPAGCARTTSRRAGCRSGEPGRADGQRPADCAGARSARHRCQPAVLHRLRRRPAAARPR